VCLYKKKKTRKKGKKEGVFLGDQDNGKRKTSLLGRNSVEKKVANQILRSRNDKGVGENVVFTICFGLFGDGESHTIRYR